MESIEVLPIIESLEFFNDGRVIEENIFEIFSDSKKKKVLLTTVLEQKRLGAKFRKNSLLKKTEKEIFSEYLLLLGENKKKLTEAEHKVFKNNFFWRLCFNEGNINIILDNKEKNETLEIKNDELEIKINFFIKKISFEDFVEIEKRKGKDSGKRLLIITAIFFVIVTLSLSIKRIWEKLFGRINMMRRREQDKIQRF